MQFVDRVLARRLESAEEMPQVYHAHWSQTNQPEVGAAVEEIAGGHMIFAGLSSPIGRAVGMGFGGPITADDMNRLEAFYFSRQAPAQVDYCPLNEPSLLEFAKQRCYGIAELNNVLARKLDGGEISASSPRGKCDAGTRHSSLSEFTIRRTRPDEEPVFSRVLRTCFFPEGGEPPGFDEMLAPMFSFPGSLTFVAEHEGQIVATGAALVIPEHKIVGLYGAGTLKQYRGRGLQTAMLERRMQAAAASGCEYAVIVTQGGTISQRNAERLGFRVVYSKATLIKAPPRE